MTAAQVIPFKQPQQPVREARMSTQKQEGYTDLPNFICDEGYLAALSGEAIKCLIFLNRHINGFHLEQKSMGEALVMKVTGIRDNRTIRKYMAELAKYQLVSIYKETGKSNVYSLTFENRLPIKPVTPYVSGQEQPVTSHATGQNLKPVTRHVAASDVPGTCHATAPVTSHATTTSDMACHPVKEIYLKENIKNIHTQVPPEKSVDEVLNLWTPDINQLNAWLQRSGVMPMTESLVQELLLEINAHYETKLKAELITDTQMYMNFVKWVKRSFQRPPVKTRSSENRNQKTNTSLNVNEAWNQIPAVEYAAVEQVEIPEDFE